MIYIIPGTPLPMKPGEVDEWRNWILAASARMVDETRIRMRRQDHIEVIGHGVTVMRDEIVRLRAERNAAVARAEAMQRVVEAAKEVAELYAANRIDARLLEDLLAAVDALRALETQP